MKPTIAEIEAMMESGQEPHILPDGTLRDYKGELAQVTRDLNDRIEDLEGALNARLAEIAELETALRWLVNLGHDVGRGGGRPEPGEWKDALTAGLEALTPSTEGK